MYGKFQQHLQKELTDIKEAGLYKNERNIASAQSAEITLQDGSVALNFCANNYLGLADSPRLIEAAKKAMESRGYGMSSVRFICGTQDLHKELEKAVSDFFKTEDTILYASCFDANGGVFEPLLTAEDAIISDSLNHASIIDGVRLCKAVRYRYANADMADLERCLQEAQAQRHRIIVTSVTRTRDDVQRLARQNVNATENSCHCYGTTFDITYVRFDKPEAHVANDDKLKDVLMQSVYDLQRKGRCYVKYERKQNCLHITVR